MASNVIQFTVRGKDDNTSKIFGSIAKAIGGIAAAIGSVVSAKEIGQTIVSFERLRLSVNTVSKSAGDAKKNMDFISDFAATTPFELEQVTESFIKLKAMGLDPSEEAMQAYGDTASAMGKSMNQMVEAVSDAVTGGEFERLKEFGIRARNMGETVSFTFKGMTTSVANNSEAIEEYLQRLGKTNFAGAMEDQANSVVGAVSNMGDTFTQLAVAIGDAGVRPLIRRVALAITGLMNTIIEHKDVMVNFIQGIVKGFLILKAVFVGLYEGIKSLFGKDLKSALDSVVDGFSRLGKIIIDWAMAVLPAVGKILIKGFPIILKGVYDGWKIVFSRIGTLMIDVIALALKSILKTFQAFGEAINDEIQAAIFGGVDQTFGENLRQRMGEHFQGAMDEAKHVLDQTGDLGNALVNNTIATLGTLADEVGPIVSESLGEIVDASGEAGSALVDLFGINMELINEQVEQMTAAQSAFKDKTTEIVDESAAVIPTMLDFFREAWQTFISDQDSFIKEFALRLVDVAKNISKSVGKSFADTVVDGKNLMKGLQDIAKDVLKSIIAHLVELAVQRLILMAVTKTAVATEAASEGGSAVGLTFANQMKSMSAAPFPINLTAPAVAAGMAGAALAGIASFGAAGAAAGAAVGAAHGGLGNVPKEATYLLDKGERVLSPNQNRDLTDYIDNDDRGGGSQFITIESIQLSVLENVSGIDNFLNMSSDEVKEVVADKIITALDSLDSEGVRPAFVDRSLNL